MPVAAADLNSDGRADVARALNVLRAYVEVTEPQQIRTVGLRYIQGQHVLVEKRRIHQWRTDLMIHVGGRAFLLGRLEGGMTRREVRELAFCWLRDRYSRYTQPK